MKMKFKLSCPIEDPQSLMDLNQPARHWLAHVISAIGTQLSTDGNRSIRIEINGAVFEFSLLSLPGCLETITFKVVGTKDGQ